MKEEEGYLNDISDRQEVSAREDTLFILLFIADLVDDVDTRRRSFTSIQLLLPLSTDATCQSSLLCPVQLYVTQTMVDKWLTGRR